MPYSRFWRAPSMQAPTQAGSTQCRHWALKYERSEESGSL